MVTIVTVVVGCRRCCNEITIVAVASNGVVTVTLALALFVIVVVVVAAAIAVVSAHVVAAHMSRLIAFLDGVLWSHAGSTLESACNEPEIVLQAFHFESV